ncbi:MAG: ABC transporter permease [Oscillospiraceae bacterium]
MDTFLNFLYASIVAATPLLFGTVGEIVTQKSGSLNLGVEGMMWMGAFAGFYVALQTNNAVLAVISAFFISLICALIYAFLTVTLKANQNVTGLTLTTFGIGLARVLGEAMTNSVGSAPVLSDALKNSIKAIHIPFLSDIPYIGKLIFGHNPFVYFAIAISLIIWFYHTKTKVGLNVRAIGENPAAADAAGINVTVLKYINIMVGGGICGIGGAYMALVTANGSWQPNGIVNGAGWIAVALVIFSSWSASKAIIGAFVFGAFSSLRYYVPADIITIPTAVYSMLPFLLTAIILVVTSIRKNKAAASPASCGVNYFREER